LKSPLHVHDNDSGDFIAPAEDSDNAGKPVNYSGQTDSFLTNEQKAQNKSVTNMKQNSASQLPFVARIKNELMATNSHELDLSNSDEEGENPYDYAYPPRSQSVAMPSGMDNDMLTFNNKGPSKNEERLRKLRKAKKNELMAYQNDSLDTGMIGQNGEKVFAETSKEQEERIRKNSPYGGLLTWKVLRIIVKANDDVRQEQFAMQLIS
jgi:hypothetical protein